jgi:hypothetical protein
MRWRIRKPNEGKKMTNATINVSYESIAIDELRQWQDALEGAESKAWKARYILEKMGFDLETDYKAAGKNYHRLKAVVTKSLPDGALALLNCDPKTLIKSKKPDPTNRFAKTTGNRRWWQQKPNSLMRDLARPYLQNAKDAAAKPGTPETPETETETGTEKNWSSREFVLAAFQAVEDKLTDVEESDYNHKRVLDLVVEIVGILAK